MPRSRPGRPTCALAAWLAVILAAVSPLASARAATLAGRVTDAETAEVLPFASVRLEAGSLVTGVLAGGDGGFVFRDLPAGPAALRVDFVGYAPGLVQPVLAAGDSVFVTVALAPQPIEFDPIEVRADRLEAERRARPSLVALGSEQVEAIPALGEQDPIRAIQFLPGVQSASDISSGLYVRGGGPDQTLVLLDEVPIYNPTHAFGLFSTFNADAIDEVKLYKGAYPARYGGRLGAVLDVRNREGPAPGAGGVGGRAGFSTITGRLLLEGPAGGGSWIASGRRTYLDPILDALRRNNEEIPAYYFWDFNGRVSLPGAPGDQWTLTGYAGRDDLFFDLQEDSRLSLAWGNRAASARWRRVLGERTVGSLMLSGTEYESTTDVLVFSTPIRFENRLRDATLRGDLAWAPRPGRQWTAGLSASAYDFRLGQSFNRDDQVRFREKPVEATGWLESEWGGDGRTVRAVGVRMRWLSDGSRFLAEPRASLSWAVRDDQRVKFAAGLYHQVVQLVSTEAFSGTDFYLPIDASTPPARSVQLVTGWEWRPTERWELSVETFWTRLDDLLALDTRQNADTGFETTESAFLTGGRGWASGLELFAQKRTGAVTGWIGYTLGWTRREFADIDGGDPFPPKYDRRHDVEVVASWRRGPWTWGAASVYATGQAFTPATARYALDNPATGTSPAEGRVLPGEKNSARLLPYFRLDLNVSRDFTMWGRPAQWFVQVFNATNRRNEWFVQFDPQGEELEPEVVHMLPLIPSLGVRFDF